MFVIDNGYAYLVNGSTGKKVTFDVLGNLLVDDSATISVTTQEQFTYDEMFKRLNFDADILSQQKGLICGSTSEKSDKEEFFDNIYNVCLKNSEIAKKFREVVYKSVVEIEDKLDDCVITFDKNGGTGIMPAVRKEVGEKYELPTCDFTAPSQKYFDTWKIGDTSYNVGDEITLSESITVKAIWETCDYTITGQFDLANPENTGGTITDSENVEAITTTLAAISNSSTEGKVIEIIDTEDNTQYVSSTIESLAESSAEITIDELNIILRISVDADEETGDPIIAFEIYNIE